jgi:hypothetical protein
VAGLRLADDHSFARLRRHDLSVAGPSAQKRDRGADEQREQHCSAVLAGARWTIPRSPQSRGPAGPCPGQPAVPEGLRQDRPTTDAAQPPRLRRTGLGREAPDTSGSHICCSHLSTGAPGFVRDSKRLCALPLRPPSSCSPQPKLTPPAPGATIRAGKHRPAVLPPAPESAFGPHRPRCSRYLAQIGPLRERS